MQVELKEWSATLAALQLTQHLRVMQVELKGLEHLLWAACGKDALFWFCIVPNVLHFHAIRLTNSAAHMWGYRPYVAQFQVRLGSSSSACRAAETGAAQGCASRWLSCDGDRRGLSPAPRLSHYSRREDSLLRRGSLWLSPPASFRRCRCLRLCLSLASASASLWLSLSVSGVCC